MVSLFNEYTEIEKLLSNFAKFKKSSCLDPSVNEFMMEIVEWNNQKFNCVFPLWNFSAFSVYTDDLDALDRRALFRSDTV